MSLTSDAVNLSRGPPNTTILAPFSDSAVISSRKLLTEQTRELLSNTFTTGKCELDNQCSSLCNVPSSLEPSEKRLETIGYGEMLFLRRTEENNIGRISLGRIQERT